MDVFSTSVEDNPNLHYGCVVTHAPRPRLPSVAKKFRPPTSALSAAVFAALQAGAGRVSEVYPPPEPPLEVRRPLEMSLGVALDRAANDGFVPTTSMLWDDVVWAGGSDHLDVLGHFNGGRTSPHTDWVASGVGFRNPEFEHVMDAAAEFLLEADH